MGVVSNPTTVTIQPASQLASAAASLSAGQYTTFLGPPTNIGQFGISWQAVTAFWDANNREFQFMAKAQSGGAASHWIYSETSHAWRYTTLSLVPGQTGHIWNVSLDYGTGDYYYLDFPLTGNFFRRMRRSVEAGAGDANSPWIVTSSPAFDIRDGSAETGIGFHPNLYGSGDGGTLLWGVGDMAAWRKSTDTWTEMQHYGGGSYWGSGGSGSGCYIPGLDKLLIGTGSTKQNFIVVSAGSGGALATNTPPLVAAPIKVFGSTTASLPWGKLVLHPSNSSKVLILEAGPKNAGLRVWSSVDAGTNWTLESYDHPFYNLPWTGNDAGAWTVGSVPTYGVLWGMAYNGTTTQSILWKPNN